MKRLLILSILFLTACAPAAGPAPAPAPVEAAPPAVPADGIWQPLPGLRWQLQFTDPFDAGVTANAYDLDLFDTDPATVAALQARGARVICYLNAGAWEDWRPDADQFPEQIIGRKYQGWPGERWLDIRRIDLLAPLLTARLDQCAAKGFDGVEPDNLDGYDNKTGFDLTAEDQLAFNRWLADQAHARGLAVGLKNDPLQAAELEPWFDFAVAEDCFDQDWCALFAPFLAAGKPVVAIEYTDTKIELEDFCPQAAALGFDALLKHRELDAYVAYCP